MTQPIYTMPRSVDHGTRRILVVDDDRLFLQFISDYLAGCGWSYFTVSSGEDAVDACRDEWFPVILMDHMLPGISGLEAARMIRGLPGGLSSVLIMITASHDPKFKEQAMTCGVDDYMHKPVDFGELAMHLSVAQCHLSAHVPSTPITPPI